MARCFDLANSTQREEIVPIEAAIAFLRERAIDNSS